MTLRRRVLPVAALVVALGSSAAGAAVAADTSGGATPKTPANGKTVVAAENGKGDKGGTDKGRQDWTAAAAKLGVTVQQLQDALKNTKLWINESGTEPTPEVVVQHVADLLHRPADKVKAVLAQLGILDGNSKGDKGGKGGKDGKGGTDKGQQDWTAAAAKLGVTVQQLQDALMNTKIWIGQTGATPTPDVFIQHLAGLLHQPADKVKTVLTQAGIFGDESKGDKGDKGDKGSKGDNGGKGDKPGTPDPKPAPPAQPAAK